MPRTVGDIAKQGLTELPMTLADELAGLLRGSAKVTLGAPGDINELARDYVAPLMPYRFRQILEGLQNVPALPTSEELDKKFAPVLPEGADPRRKISAKIGEGVGEWTPFNPVAATRMAGRAAGRGLKAVDKAISTAPTSGGRKSQRGVIKAPGGNWLSNNALEAELRDTKQALTANNFQRQDQNDAINNWIDSNLANYVKKQMGTEGDPLRALAEQGITHTENLGARYGGNPGGVTARRRAEAGFPEEGFGKSPEARQWEHAADVAIRSRPVSKYFADATPANTFVVDNNQWMNKVPQDTNVHHLSYGSLHELGFPKLIENLQDELAAGVLRPEQLNKVSVPDAVQRSFAIKEAARKAKESAEAAAVRANLALNPYKEYPSGHKWITLPDPTESDESMKAVKDIGCQGGWCTQGEAEAAFYGDPLEGNALHVLLDPSGKPHVQLHVESVPQDKRFPGKGLPEDINSQLQQQAKEFASTQPIENIEEFNANLAKFPQWKDWDLHNRTHAKYKELENEFRVNNPQYQYPQSVTQIKPFSNNWGSQMVADATKKNPNYRKEIEPMVQDFIRSGRWDRVDDLSNAGLRRSTDVFNPLEKATLQKLGHDVPSYITPAEEAELQAKFAAHYQAKQASGEYPVIQGDEPPMPDLITGFKTGGKVNLEDQYRLNKLNGTILGTQYRK